MIKERIFVTYRPVQYTAKLAYASRYFDVCEDIDQMSLATQNGNRAIFAHIVSLVFDTIKD